MVITQLPRFHYLVFKNPPPSFNFIPKPKLPIIKPASPTLFSTLSAAEPTPIADFAPPDEPKLDVSLDKLFVPAETEVSRNDPNLSTRILRGSNVVLSKYARDAQVVQAEFVKSSVRTEDCPSDGLPELALVGRSNVGKSSLLNSLVRRKRLALTSKKPGKTQCINHFRINDEWYLVDLPGYGYASAPQELRTDWVKFTRDYFINRSTLVSFSYL
ncbi:putative GTP-binding protein EngB [Hibiscus syriacus]|uniref:GTP-binding protein EngB n=1 Tax=Hibiscus syriacus TaxID=106335 RepID=A0A6A3D1A0_HIBSY|nr:putative GTP-binding protein EngB [Hibiscus syriacus]